MCKLVFLFVIIPVVFSLDRICKDISETGVIVDPYSCEHFYFCNKGVASRKECPVNERFSQVQSKCVSKSILPCDEDLICPANSVISLPSLQNCEEYFLCDKGTMSYQICPKTTHFSEQTETCEIPEVANCKIPEINCSEVDPETPIFIPHYDSCSKFSYCQNGEKKTSDCSPLHWDQLSKKCISLEESNCNIEGTTKDPLTTTESSTVVPPDYDCPEKDEDLKPVFFASTVKCEDFYWCRHGDGLLFSCPNNLHWNQKKYACDEPLEVNCVIKPFNDCPATGQQLVPHPTNCEYFYFCNQGVKIRQKCPNFYRFDKYDKTCKLQSYAKC